MKLNIFIITIFSFLVIGCGGSDSANDPSIENIDVIGVWKGPCLGTETYNWEFTELGTIYLLVETYEFHGCVSSIFTEVISQAEYELQEYVTTESGVSAQVLALSEADSVFSRLDLVYRDGDTLYLGYGTINLPPADVDYIVPYTLEQ